MTTPSRFPLTRDDLSGLRDRIVKKYLTGWSQSRIAAEEGVTAVRVHQILKSEMAERWANRDQIKDRTVAQLDQLARTYWEAHFDRREKNLPPNRQDDELLLRITADLRKLFGLDEAARVKVEVTDVAALSDEELQEQLRVNQIPHSLPAQPKSLPPKSEPETVEDAEFVGVSESVEVDADE